MKYIRLLRRMQEGRRGDSGTETMWTPKAPTTTPIEHTMMVEMSCALQKTFVKHEVGHLSVATDP